MSKNVISVKRDSDGEVFTSDMSKDKVIIEIHFSTSYTQVETQEFDGDNFIYGTIICPAIGGEANPLDFIAVQSCETGTLV